MAIIGFEWNQVDDIVNHLKMKSYKTLILSDGEYKKYEEGSPAIKSADLTSEKTYASSSSYSGTNPSMAFDDNTSTRWMSATGGGNHWVSVDLGEDKRITKATLTQDIAYRTKDFRIEYSNDNSTWVSAYSGVLLQNTNKQEFYFDSGSHRYWRLYIVTNHVSANAAGIAEIELMEADTPAISPSWKTVSPTLPTLAQFQEEGMEDLSILDRKVQQVLGSPQQMTDNGVLGEGKVFKGAVDLKKYFDLRKLEVK